MADTSPIANALHPGIAKLRQQLAGLLPDTAPAASAAVEAARPTLMQQAMDNAPMLMELGTMLLRLVRGAPDAVERQAPAPPPPARRIAVLRPVLIVVAVAGTAYLVSRALRPRTGRR